MVCMTQEQFDSEMAKIQQRNQTREFRRRLRRERWGHIPKFTKPSTSKIVLIVSALLCVEILAFCQYMIVVTGDTNALYAMVGALFTFMAVVLGYFVKSTRENTAGGIIYESAMVGCTQPPVEAKQEETVEAVG